MYGNQQQNCGRGRRHNKRSRSRKNQNRNRQEDRFKSQGNQNRNEGFGEYAPRRFSPPRPAYCRSPSRHFDSNSNFNNYREHPRDRSKSPYPHYRNSSPRGLQNNYPSSSRGVQNHQNRDHFFDRSSSSSRGVQNHEYRSGTPNSWQSQSQDVRNCYSPRGVQNRRSPSPPRGVHNNYYRSPSPYSCGTQNRRSSSCSRGVQDHQQWDQSSSRGVQNDQEWDQSYPRGVQNRSDTPNSWERRPPSPPRGVQNRRNREHSFDRYSSSRGVQNHQQWGRSSSPRGLQNQRSSSSRGVQNQQHRDYSYDCFSSSRGLQNHQQWDRSSSPRGVHNQRSPSPPGEVQYHEFRSDTPNSWESRPPSPPRGLQNQRSSSPRGVQSQQFRDHNFDRSSSPRGLQNRSDTPNSWESRPQSPPRGLQNQRPTSPRGVHQLKPYERRYSNVEQSESVAEKLAASDSTRPNPKDDDLFDSDDEGLDPYTRPPLQHYPNPSEEWKAWLREQDDVLASENVDLRDILDDFRTALIENGQIPGLDEERVPARHPRGDAIRERIPMAQRERTMDEWRRRDALELPTSRDWQVAAERPISNEPTFHTHRRNEPKCSLFSRLQRHFVHKEYVNSRLKHDCIYCQRRHRPDECPFVKDVNERREHLERNGHCTRCLRRHRRNTVCDRLEGYPCDYCGDENPTGDRHHWSICPEAYNGPGEDETVEEEPVEENPMGDQIEDEFPPL